MERRNAPGGDLERGRLAGCALCFEPHYARGISSRPRGDVIVETIRRTPEDRIGKIAGPARDHAMNNSRPKTIGGSGRINVDPDTPTPVTRFDT